MKRCGDISVLLVLIYGAVVVHCNISVEGTKCGQVNCKRGEYCSQFHTACEPCANVCDRTHNFDKTQCEANCQDYLHDQRYVLKDNQGPGDENLRATVQRLSHMVTVMLVFVCFMLIVLATMLTFQVYKWKKNKNITLASIKNKFFSKKSDSSSPNKTIPDQTINAKPDLRLEMPAESTHSGNSPVTVTTSISRRPEEDDTSGYAYDNHGMSSSPSHKNSRGSF